VKRVGLALLRHVLAVLVLLVSALLLALPGIGFFSGLTPPPAISVGTYDAPTLHGDERRIAHGRLRPVGALRYLALDGDPVENGYAHGALVGDLLTRLEGEMLERFTELVPAPPLRHLLLGWVSWSNRGLAEQLSAAELHELAAMGAGYDAHHRRYGGLPAFTRGLQYQALHDASQYLIDNPLVNAPAVGCTAIALRGRRSADGALLVGRLFDFEGGEAFDRDKLVVRVRPDHGLGYLSVAWPGSLGAVTGFNEARLWVSLNAGLSSGQRLAGGRPITLVIRRVLAEAASIDEAIAIIEASDVGVSCAVLLADGDEDRAVVVEKGPSGCAVRKMRDDRLIVFACHDARVLMQRGVNGIDDAGRLAGAAAQGFIELPEAEHRPPIVTTEGLGDPVGVKDECLARIQSREFFFGADLIEYAQGRSGGADDGERFVGAGSHLSRGRMTSVRGCHRAARDVVHAIESGHETALDPLGGHVLIEPSQGFRRSGEALRLRVEQRVGHRGDGCGAGAVPGDISYEDTPPVLTEIDEIVVIAA